MRVFTKYKSYWNVIKYLVLLAFYEHIHLDPNQSLRTFYVSVSDAKT